VNTKAAGSNAGKQRVAGFGLRENLFVPAVVAQANTTGMSAFANDSQGNVFWA
jgi:hypothetical protein